MRGIRRQIPPPPPPKESSPTQPVPLFVWGGGGVKDFVDTIIAVKML